MPLSKSYIISAANAVVRHAHSVLPLAHAKLSKSYYYAGLPHCVIDSVFSIGAHYSGTMRTVQEFCKAQCWAIYRNTATLPPCSAQQTISDLLQVLGNRSPDILAVQVFNNRQRTSTKNGVLKAEAVLLFAQTLKAAGIEYFQDLRAASRNQQLDAALRSLPGQTSGVSVRYLHMLAGSEMDVKPDRMILRFIENAAKIRPSPREAILIVRAACRALRGSFPDLTPRLLDHEIWKYQR